MVIYDFNNNKTLEKYKKKSVEKPKGEIKYQTSKLYYVDKFL